jgi:membrane protease YdiL (CAAX protease family)
MVAAIRSAGICRFESEARSNLCHTRLMPRLQSSPVRDLVELIFGYGLLLVVLWTPEFPQRILTPLALIATLGVVLARRPSWNELGLGWQGLASSLWILPAACALAAASVFAAAQIGTLHALYQGDFTHVAGYVLWTLYQQFLLQDYFFPRLVRIASGEAAAIVLSAMLFAAAHLPNLPLTAATLVWGAVSCLLFRRYRNLYVLGLAQGLLGLCFAVCVPDALHHQMRVGLGYFHYHSAQPVP